VRREAAEVKFLEQGDFHPVFPGPYHSSGVPGRRLPVKWRLGEIEGV